MTGLPSSRTRWLVVGLVALTGIALGFLSTRGRTPVAQPTVEAADCSSCDARHARLADLQAAQPKEAE